MQSFNVLVTCQLAAGDVCAITGGYCTSWKNPEDPGYHKIPIATLTKVIWVDEDYARVARMDLPEVEQTVHRSDLLFQQSNLN